MNRYAYFAGGCFWCITPVFYEQEGVTDVRSGYSGGDEVNPTYEAVKKQMTGHREAIRITYDPDKITYTKLLNIYLASVDPFDGGGQFIDRGASYTLAIYYMDQEEKKIAEERIAHLQERSGRKVCIALDPWKNFYDAEDYHQNFFEKNPDEFAQEMKESGRLEWMASRE